MANISETSTFDAAIHEIATTDAVIGGDGAPINLSIGSLANRTRYLYDTVSALALSAAPLNSPALTGSPTAPTAAVGDSSTKLATTAFVAGADRGDITIDVSGNSNVTLSPAQYGVATIIFIGALTGNINIIFPDHGRWNVINNTTGTKKITAKTAAGTGTVVTQTKSLPIICDGTNCNPALTDLATIGAIVRTQAGGSYTFKQGDYGETFQSSLISTFTLDPTVLTAGWFARVCVPEQSTITTWSATLTPNNGATLDGLTTRSGMQGTDVTIYFDGTNFTTQRGLYRYLKSTSFSNGAITGPFTHFLGRFSVGGKAQLCAVSPAGNNGYGAGAFVPLANDDVALMIDGTNVSIGVGTSGITLPSLTTFSAFTLSTIFWNLFIILETG